MNLTADAHPIHLHLVQFQIMNRQNYNVNKCTKAYAAAFQALGGCAAGVSVLASARPWTTKLEMREHSAGIRTSYRSCKALLRLHHPKKRDGKIPPSCTPDR